jgi:hypothetical protein
MAGPADAPCRVRNLAAHAAPHPTQTWQQRSHQVCGYASVLAQARFALLLDLLGQVDARVVQAREALQPARPGFDAAQLSFERLLQRAALQRQVQEFLHVLFLLEMVPGGTRSLKMC